MNWACRYCPWYDSLNIQSCNVSDSLCPYTILSIDNTFFLNKHGFRGDNDIK